MLTVSTCLPAHSLLQLGSLCIYLRGVKFHFYLLLHINRVLIRDSDFITGRSRGAFFCEWDWWRGAQWQSGVYLSERCCKLFRMIMQTQNKHRDGETEITLYREQSWFIGKVFFNKFLSESNSQLSLHAFFLSCRKCKDLLITSLCAAGCNTVLLFLLNSQERSWRRCFSHSKRACQLYSCSTHINTQLDSMPGRHKSQP